MRLTNGPNVYEVGEQVAAAQDYNLYLCTVGEGEEVRQCLLQVAKTAEQNGSLDRAAFILRELARRAEELEVEFAKTQTDPDSRLNLHLGFPELVDSFVCHEQGGRRINILAFRNVAEVGRMVPLINITEKDGLRVDLRTSAWILGKLLKLLVFTHGEGFAIGQLAGNNILIESEQHYVLLFDWSGTHTYTEAIPAEVRSQEISAVAKAVIAALGGDPETGDIPNGDGVEFDRYTAFVARLARGDERSAERAHKDHYEILDGLWPREYYPFTAHPL
jgi:hypothetical protein